jgi:hypothetical protein
MRSNESGSLLKRVGCGLPARNYVRWQGRGRMRVASQSFGAGSKAQGTKGAGE